MLGKTVTVIVDRPLGSRHPNFPNLYYPVNYGYVEGIFSGDGEEQDAYILGIDTPLELFTGQIVAIIHRLDDVEDKWVVAPFEVQFDECEIIKATYFQEQHFNSIVYTFQGKRRYHETTF